MEDFWKSVQTIQAERGADYRAFPLFGAVHWAELLVAIAIVVLCAMIYRRCREMTRQQILRAVFVLMLADEFMKQAVLLYTGQWNVTYLPLHLCSINIFVCWYDAVHQSRRSKEILYALCLPGAVVAMLSPSWQRLPVWNLLHLHSYSIHVLLILYPVLLLAGGFRPQVHHIRWVLAFLCATATPIFFLNRMLKTNFFFLNDPQGNAITAFFAHCLGERFYLMGFLPVLAAVLSLLYLPWVQGRAASTDALCKKSSCGLNDPIMVLAYVVLFLPYTVQYVTSSFTQISDSLMAAGQVFGGSPAYILRRITLPLIRQGIATGWMMTFIIAFRELVTASLIAPPNTLVVSTFIVREFEQGSVSVGMAMAVLCVLFSTTALLILNTVIDHRKVH